MTDRDTQPPPAAAVGEPKAREWDHRTIDAVSFALGGRIGADDDAERLMAEVQGGNSGNKLFTACQIAVAFIRWAQDLKAQLAAAQAEAACRREASNYWNRRYEETYKCLRDREARIAELTRNPCGDPSLLFTAGSLRQAGWAGYHAALGDKSLMDAFWQAAKDQEAAEHRAWTQGLLARIAELERERDELRAKLSTAEAGP